MAELPPPPPYQEQEKGQQQQGPTGAAPHYGNPHPPYGGSPVGAPYGGQPVSAPYGGPPVGAPYGGPPVGAPYGDPSLAAPYGGSTASYPGTQPAHGYPTQAQTYPPVTNQPQHTVIVAQTPVVMTGNYFGEAAVSMVCPHCRCQIVTQRNFEIGGLAWLICLLLAFFGFWLCCFIPFCVDGCKDVEHICPSCRRSLGWYRRL